MKQHEFIWLGNNMNVEKMAMQDEDGNTIILMRKQIILSHNYKKDNMMLITFSEDGVKFHIPSRKELEFIYGLHLTNEDVVQIVRKYCQDNLKQIV